VGEFSQVNSTAQSNQVERIARALVACCTSATLGRDVKPKAIEALGDLALALNKFFVPFLPLVMPVLHSAAQVPLHVDPSLVNELRESIMQTYTCVLMGMKDAGTPQLLAPFVAEICVLLRDVAEDDDRDEMVTLKAVGLIGDIGSALGAEGAVRQQLAQVSGGENRRCSVCGCTVWGEQRCGVQRCGV
jgi:importin subunit beta-1